MKKTESNRNIHIDKMQFSQYTLLNIAILVIHVLICLKTFCLLPKHSYWRFSFFLSSFLPFYLFIYLLIYHSQKWAWAQSRAGERAESDDSCSMDSGSSWEQGAAFIAAVFLLGRNYLWGFYLFIHNSMFPLIHYLEETLQDMHAFSYPLFGLLENISTSVA